MTAAPPGRSERASGGPGRTPSSPSRSVPRLHLITGKGGVGKSTLTAALAVAAAARGMRPLVVELGHRATMDTVFGVPPIGYAPCEVAPGVFAMNMDLDQAVLDYATRYVKLRGAAKRVLGSAALRAFFQAAPAAFEVASVAKLGALLEETRGGGASAWDLILVDLDATGHALMFLDLPRVFEGIAPPGPLRRVLDGLTGIFGDAAITRLHVVTLAAELPVQETIELLAKLDTDTRVTRGAVLVNAVQAPPVAPEVASQIEAVIARARASGDAALLEDAAEAAAAFDREARARAAIARLAERVARDLAVLPFDDEPEDPAARIARLQRLGVRALDAVTGAAR